MLVSREGRRGGDRVRDSVETHLERELDSIRGHQKKLRDLLKQVKLYVR